MIIPFDFLPFSASYLSSFISFRVLPNLPSLSFSSLLFHFILISLLLCSPPPASPNFARDSFLLIHCAVQVRDKSLHGIASMLSKSLVENFCARLRHAQILTSTSKRCNSEPVLGNQWFRSRRLVGFVLQVLLACHGFFYHGRLIFT